MYRLLVLERGRVTSAADTTSGPHLACPSCVPPPAPPAQNVAPRARVSVCSQVNRQLHGTRLLGRNEDRV